MLVSAHFLIRCDLVSLNAILFICNFPVLFFPATTTKSLISKLIFWCTTLITLYIQIHTKGRLNNAPINVNPVGGGVRARGGDLTNFKIFRSNSPGWETKGQSKVSKKPHPRGKNLNKQYYNTV